MDEFVRLSSTQFEQVLLSLGKKTDAGPKERRLAPRVGLAGHLRVFPIRDAKLGESVQVRLRDVSDTGVGIIHESPLPVGTNFIARFLSGNAGTGELVLICTVVNCRRAASQLYAIGATFKKQIRTQKAPTAPKPDAPAASPPAAGIWPTNPDSMTPQERARIQEAMLS
jgi:hypothetical protein